VNNHNQTLSATMHTRPKSHWPQFQPEVNANDVTLILFASFYYSGYLNRRGKSVIFITNPGQTHTHKNQ